MAILKGVIPYVMNEGVWVRGAAHEEFDKRWAITTYTRIAQKPSTSTRKLFHVDSSNRPMVYTY